MATTTPNFGWSVPTSTDLVKDGATAIETLGDSIDASLVDLKGGTSGQVLAKNSNTDMDFVWVAQDDSNAIQNAIVDAKGDIIAATANDTPARLAVGANNTVLTADSSTATGLKWATPAGGSGFTLIKRASFSNVAGTSTTFDDVFSSTYQTYKIVVEKIYATTAADDLQFQLRYAGPTTQTADYYGNTINMTYDATTVTGVSVNGASQATLSTGIGNVTNGQNSSAELTIFCPNDNTTRTRMNGSSYDSANGVMSFYGYFMNNLTTYTGFLLKSSSTNVTGTVSVYGLATA